MYAKKQVTIRKTRALQVKGSELGSKSMIMRAAVMNIGRPKQ